MAANKRRQEKDNHVKEIIHDKQAINDYKIKYSAMIR